MGRDSGFSRLSKVGVFSTLALTLSVLVLSPRVIGGQFDFENERWVLFGLGAAATLLGGLRYFVSAARELGSKAPGQYVLGSLGLLILAGYASWQTLGDWRQDAWWQVASIAAVLSLGEWYFSALQFRVTNSVPDLLSLLPEFADVIVDKEISRVRASELEVGDIILVRPGAVVPADGVVVQGSSTVDEQDLTGETLAVNKVEGSEVFAGTLNSASKKSAKALTIRVTATGGDLLVEGFSRKVLELAQERGAVDSLSSKLNSGLFILTIASALIGGGLWLVLDPSNWPTAIFCAAAVLLAANLAIISKASSLVGVMLASVAGSGGVLVRGRNALYRIRKSHIVVLNLVGTLTSGEPKLVAIHLARGTSLGSPREVLAVAAAADSNSSHPLARVILDEAAKRKIEPVELYELEMNPLGVSARMDGSSVLVGNAGILTANQVPIDVNDLVVVSSANERANQVVYVVIDNLLVGYLEFSDEVRETAREAITQLHGQRKRIVAITGEAAGVTEAVCKSLGITEFFAEVPKDRKVDIIDQLRKDGSIITVVGDPIGDSAILAAADVGIAIGVGAELGTQSADLEVITNEPRAVSRIMRLARRATRTVNLSLTLVTVFDVVAVAAAGFFAIPLASAGFVLLSTIVAGTSIWGLRK